MNTNQRGQKEMLSLIAGLLLLAGVLLYFWGRWVCQPLMLIGFSVLGTQFGAGFGRRVLNNLAAKTTAEAPAEIEGNRLDTKDSELLEVIKIRNKQAQTPAGAALNSYLSQVVGTFAMVFLIVGVCLILMFHRILGVDRPDWVLLTAGLVVVVVCILLFWLLIQEPLHSKSISPYYNWPGFFPPKTALTFFRIAVLIIYSGLVFILYYPNHKPVQTSPTSPSTTKQEG